MNSFRAFRHFSWEHDTLELFLHCSKRRNISVSFQKTVQANRVLLHPTHSCNVFRKGELLYSVNWVLLQCNEKTRHSSSMFNKHGIPAVHSGIRTPLQHLHETRNSCSVQQTGNTCSVANGEHLQCIEQTGNTRSALSKQGTPAVHWGNREHLQCIEETGNTCSVLRKQGTPAVHWANKEHLQCTGQTRNTCSVLSKRGTPAVHWGNRKHLKCTEQTGNTCSSLSKRGTPAVHWGNRKHLQCTEQTGNTCSALSKQVTPEMYSGKRELLQTIPGRRAHSSYVEKVSVLIFPDAGNKKCHSWPRTRRARIQKWLIHKLCQPVTWRQHAQQTNENDIYYVSSVNTKVEKHIC
jgi:hypothetical protein